MQWEDEKDREFIQKSEFKYGLDDGEAKRKSLKPINYTEKY